MQDANPCQRKLGGSGFEKGTILGEKKGTFLYHKKVVAPMVTRCLSACMLVSGSDDQMVVPPEVRDQGTIKAREHPISWWIPTSILFPASEISLPPIDEFLFIFQLPEGQLRSNGFFV